jgi:small ligand-binding sensory domain FIST
MPTAHFASALSVRPESADAIGEAVEELSAELGGNAPNLVCAFATHHYGSELEQLGPRLAKATGTDVVIGCTAESVIGRGREVERQPGLAVWAASLPETEVRYFEISATDTGKGEAVFSDYPPVRETKRSSIILTVDPFSFPIDPFLRDLNERYEGVPVMGGMASGAMGPGQTLFFTADGVSDSGCVGVVLEGAIGLHPVVSQGCRPVGKPWVITDCERNIVKKLGGRPALEVVMETWNRLPKVDQELMQSAPFLGLAIDATRTTFQRGEFLVRGIMGLHQRERAIAVADFVRRGQTVQLLVRDAESAGEDLRFLLGTMGGGEVPIEEPSSAGALIFSCNGRGCRMFESPHHDANCIRDGLSADVPVAGFFAAGEIGPVGRRNFLHGFTASVALFRPTPD